MGLPEEERVDSGTTGAVVIPRLHLSLHDPNDEGKCHCEREVYVYVFLSRGEGGVNKEVESNSE